MTKKSRNEKLFDITNGAEPSHIRFECRKAFVPFVPVLERVAKAASTTFTPRDLSSSNNHTTSFKKREGRLGRKRNLDLIDNPVHL